MKLRVLQIIDSLRPGGAEKMAVNIANALLPHVEGSYLCCTRQEGMFKDEVKPEVGYLFLEKKNRLDIKAILRLRKFINENDINVVHAHSTSFFLAGLLKITGSNFKLVWHDHYGESENLKEREYKVLKKFSRLFTGIIAVNTDLKEWALQNLNCRTVLEIKNFIADPEPSAMTKIRLIGNKNDFKIICVANLRPQKDHLNLLQAFEMLDSELSISLHLIGEDPGTDYSASLLEAIENSPVNHKIFYYGTQPDIISLLPQANLAVLSSRSEGLPLALIEYGMAGLPVICTGVGKCVEVIEGCGEIVPKENPRALSKRIKFYLMNRSKMKLDAQLFQIRVKEEYSESRALNRILDLYK